MKITTKIHFFSFDLDKENDKEKWEELKKMLKDLGIKPFIYNTMVNGYSKYIIPAENRTENIELDTDWLAGNQWNGNCDTLKNHRIFDFFLLELPNKKIKRGYWLEPTYETMDIRGQFRCGYCGKIVGYNPEGDYHTHCFGNEFMEEKFLHCTKYRRIWQNSIENEKLPEEIMDLFVIKKKETMTRKLEKTKRQTIDNLTEKVKDTEHEFTWKKYLVDHGFFDIDNVIFYQHKKEFNFGWRRVFSKDEAESLSKFLDSINFPSYTIEKHIY